MTTTLIGLLIGAASAAVLLVLWRIAERLRTELTDYQAGETAGDRISRRDRQSTTPTSVRDPSGE